MMRNIKYLIAGAFFGVVLVKSEVISWFRIQEMFRLQAFHMYGIIGSAIVVGMISVFIIKRISTLKLLQVMRSLYQLKGIHCKGNIYGGLIFGVGWAITGACPGPLFAQIGSGFLVTIATLLSAVAGTWVYGLLRENGCRNNKIYLQ